MSGLLMAILTTRPIEDFIGWAARNKRGHDAGLITRSPQISSVPKTVTVTCPEIGESGSPMAKSYASSEIGGSDKIPTISWSVTGDLKSQVKEWVLLKEDPDAPTAEPIVHGIYYGIATSKTSTSQADFDAVSPNDEAKRLKGGFYYGRNRRRTVYVAPRPIMGHGAHRYFWSVLGLGDTVDWAKVRQDAGSEGVEKKALLRAVDGKVVAWGEWIGTYERV